VVADEVIEVASPALVAQQVKMAVYSVLMHARFTHRNDDLDRSNPASPAS
jgi:hypothetical protein